MNTLFISPTSVPIEFSCKLTKKTIQPTLKNCNHANLVISPVLKSVCVQWASFELRKLIIYLCIEFMTLTKTATNKPEIVLVKADYEC